MPYWICKFYRKFLCFFLSIELQDKKCYNDSNNRLNRVYFIEV